MYLDYDVLKRYCDNGNKIGDWNNTEVYVSKSDLLKSEYRSNYYILYDDGNKLVGFINGYWQVVGYVSSRGSVTGCNRYKYEFPNEKVSRNEMKNSNEKMNSKNENEMKNSKNENEMKNSNKEVIGDVRLGLMVDEMLSSARNMTIDSLLVGFNYGLEEAKG